MIHKKLEMKYPHGFTQKHTFLIYFYSFKANQNVAAEFLHNEWSTYLPVPSTYWCNQEEFTLL